MEKGYKKLLAWTKTDELAFKIYLATKQFPPDELFGLTSQLRRAALSIPTNIAEGMGRQNKKETRQFLNIALGSIFEVEYLLEFSKRLNYLSETNYSNLDRLRKEAGALLWGLHKSF